MIKKISKLILLIFFLICIWSIPGRSEGYIKFGVWPRHNEDILNAHNDISKFRIELNQKFKINRIELELNPIFKFGGEWPKYTKEYGYDWINGEYNLIFNFLVMENTKIYYHKKWYRDIYYKNIAHPCNCTYSNEIGLQFSW